MKENRNFSGKLFEFNFRNLRLIAGICLTMVLSISTTVLLGKFIDILGSGNLNFNENFYYIIGLFILTFSSLICTLFFVKYFPLKLELEKSMDISMEIMRGVLKLPQKFYQKNDSGYYMNLVTSSAYTFANIFTRVNAHLIGNILCVVILILVSAFINPIFSIIFLLYIPVFYFITQAPSKKISEFQKIGLPTQDSFISGTKQIVTDKKAINVNRAEKFYFKSYDKKMKNYLDFITKYRFFEIASQETPNILSGMLRILILAFSTYLFYKNQISLGTIILMFQLSGLIQEPLSTCFQILIYKSVNKVHLDRIREFIKISDEKSGFEKYYKRQENLISIQNGKFFTTSSKEKLLFTIDNLEIEKNSLIVVKGENGSGKSMFINFITGFSDPESFEGKISLDDSLKTASYLSYPILLVDGSIDTNLFNKIPKNNLFEILNIDFKNKIIDEKIRNLSFGEQQKLNLLRVLSKDEEVIILDEPFTNLDKETIESLTQHILKLKKQFSIIAITHSPELDENADYILNIENNRMTNLKLKN